MAWIFRQMRSRNLLTTLLAAVILAFFSVPIGIILYGGGAAAIGGMAIIGTLILLSASRVSTAEAMGLDAEG